MNKIEKTFNDIAEMQDQLNEGICPGWIDSDNNYYRAAKL